LRWSLRLLDLRFGSDRYHDYNPYPNPNPYPKGEIDYKRQDDDVKALLQKHKARIDAGLAAKNLKLHPVASSKSQANLRGAASAAADEANPFESTAVGTGTGLVFGLDWCCMRSDALRSRLLA
jgi:ElaB/YqjD/DUF883 family membrane-anchored ribosome-binding protein